MKKRHFKRILSLALVLATALTCLAGCGVQNVIPTEKIEGSDIYVKKVENLPDDFIMGMDASSVLAEEASGVKYYNFDGVEQDVFKTLAENGVNVSVSGRSSTRLDMTERGIESLVRASVHYYNTEEELERVCDLLKTFL